ncbi:NAD(P)/FAD-dependent oxidoreductase [Candidatus Micrarchaeota archaeon]|nr:NAD(P)/FAD-dependent oxidoreductase [Candidatus Micrarchaeota archaeon]
MMDTYDLAIVGAGPAGGSTALHAAKLGLKTVVLEEHASVGEPVHCGECLSGLAVDKFFKQLPGPSIGLRVKGIRVIFPSGYSPILNEPGYVLEKHLFEQWLASQAQEAGAEISLSSKVTEFQRNGIWKLKTPSREVQSKLLVDASGVSAIASLKLKLNPRFSDVIGMQHELREIPNEGYIDFFIWPELAPHGYLWMIPKKDGRANVGLVTNQKSKAKVFLDLFLKKMGWENKPRVKTFGGLIPASGPVPHTVADGLMLVGDAAGFTSPLFEGGSHLGMQSGQFAAQVAKEAIDSNDVTASKLSKYEQLWKAEFPDYAKLIKGKNDLYALSESELNDLASLLPSDLTNMGLTGKAGVGLGLLTKKPALLAKGALDALKAFQYSRASKYGW